jgi:hypothetical protein
MQVCSEKLSSDDWLVIGDRIAGAWEIDDDIVAPHV